MLPAFADFWNAFWAAVFGALAGAAAAFELERRRRRAERLREEMGKCYTLHFYVMHMASVLGDFQEHLFGKEGDPPRPWEKIGSLDGAPERGSDFETEKYAFLLDGSSKDPNALILVNRVYLARVNFNSTLARLHSRNRLWSELFERRLGNQFIPGEDALGVTGQQQAVGARIEELTNWLSKDFSETIEELEALQPLMHQVFRARYPKQPFIVSARKSEMEAQHTPSSRHPLSL